MISARRGFMTDVQALSLRSVLIATASTTKFNPTLSIWEDHRATDAMIVDHIHPLASGLFSLFSYSHFHALPSHQLHGGFLLMSKLHLPTEVLEVIVNAIPVTDMSTLSTLLRVCGATYALAAPRLYADLRITDANLSQLLHGLLHEHRPRHYPGAAYPTPTSNARKRALLAYTTTLQIDSVPEIYPREICPIDKGTFPAVKTVLVRAPVPYHTDLGARRMARLTAPAADGLSSR